MDFNLLGNTWTIGEYEDDGFFYHFTDSIPDFTPYENGGLGISYNGTQYCVLKSKIQIGDSVNFEKAASIIYSGEISINNIINE